MDTDRSPCSATRAAVVSRIAVRTSRRCVSIVRFHSLGTPDKVGAQGYFEELSWENAGKYDADVIYLDDRAAALQPKDLAAKPTWSQLPAVKAGQVEPWASEPRFSYAGFAPKVEALAKAIREAKKVS
ncbi:MAG: ABC transporter substrate-binding protein [Streptosporangiales bacterium]|nr:ABC transporter substrate-binding protein [Streptosporangiales bacterium]